MKKLITIILAAVFIAACGIGGPSGLTIKMRGTDTPFEKKTALAVMRPDIKETSFVFANYDLDLPDKSIRGSARPTQPGQIKISFAVEAEKADFENPLKPGEFTDKMISWAIIDTAKESDQVSFRGSDNKISGKITITEVTADTIKGSIDVSTDNSSLKGPFEAKIIARK